MAWSTPLTAVASASLTAAQWNASVRANFLETAPAKATAANGHFVSTGPNAIAQRFITEAIVDATEGTTSTSYTSLSTNGPEVSVDTGTKALVFVTAQQANSTSGTTCYASFEITGATTSAAADTRAVISQNPSNIDMRATCVSLMTLTAGTNSFRMLYRCGSGGGTGSFTRRRVTVVPL